MGQLNFIEGDGWHEIIGTASRTHYFTADQGGRDFPISLCGKMFSGDIYLADEERPPKCKACLHRLSQNQSGVL